MKGALVAIAAVIALLFTTQISAQKKRDLSLFDIPPKLNKARLVGVSVGGGLAYSAVVVGLNQAWYSQHEQTKFHFYNDNKEWLQHDKIGHIWTAYVETNISYNLYKWTGLNERKSLIVGSVLGWSFQATIEVLDGFSKRWGASPGDIVANTIGVGFFTAQQLIWGDQIFQWKYSTHKVDYNAYPEVYKQRAANLYGTSFSERILKDYNGQTYWLSFNPVRLFNEESSIPDWLQLSLGYGITDVFGGFENKWQLENGLIFDGSEVKQKRQFYLSMDIDLTKIPVKKRWAKTLLGALNSFKFPLPAFQFNSDGGFKFQPLMW